MVLLSLLRERKGDMIENEGESESESESEIEIPMGSYHLNPLENSIGRN